MAESDMKRRYRIERGAFLCTRGCGKVFKLAKSRTTHERHCGQRVLRKGEYIDADGKIRRPRMGKPRVDKQSNMPGYLLRPILAEKRRRNAERQKAWRRRRQQDRLNWWRAELARYNALRTHLKVLGKRMQAWKKAAPEYVQIRLDEPKARARQERRERKARAAQERRRRQKWWFARGGA